MKKSPVPILLGTGDFLSLVEFLKAQSDITDETLA